MLSSRSTYVRARGDAGAGRAGTAGSQQHGKRDTDSALATTRALDALRAACAPLRQLQRARREQKGYQQPATRRRTLLSTITRRAKSVPESQNTETVSDLHAREV